MCSKNIDMPSYCHFSLPGERWSGGTGRSSGESVSTPLHILCLLIHIMRLETNCFIKACQSNRGNNSCCLHFPKYLPWWNGLLMARISCCYLWVKQDSIVSKSYAPSCYLVVLGCAKMQKGSWSSGGRWRKEGFLGLAKDTSHVRAWKQGLRFEHFVQG